MRYFNGFSLREEEALLEEWLESGPTTVAGFSYGAIKAFRYALEAQTRVDLLQLVSPAFFQTKAAKFRRLQKMAFKKNRDTYLETFLENVARPAALELDGYLAPGTEEELEELLEYRWEAQEVQALVEKGTRLEVFLGGNDAIIDAAGAREFFRPYATVYWVKEGGHLLWEK